MAIPLQDRYKEITKRLTDLYRSKSFLDKKINELESDLIEIGRMMDFADGLEGKGRKPVQEEYEQQYDFQNFFLEEQPDTDSTGPINMISIAELEDEQNKRQG